MFIELAGVNKWDFYTLLGLQVNKVTGSVLVRGDLDMGELLNSLEYST